jgi:GTP cyclohydrolase I
MGTKARTLSLGERVHRELIKYGIETPICGPMHEQVNQIIRRGMVDTMLALGLNVYNDDSLKDTPARVAKMYTQEIFWGLDYLNFPGMTAIENKMQYDEMVATKCTIKSMCEHHFVPFIGEAHIAYIPKTKVLGLSKFNRVADFFSRRPQVQERLTAQIHCALQFILKTQDVAVVIKAKHYCVHLRGVEDSNSETVTSKVGGKFFKVKALRDEFLALTR